MMLTPYQLIAKRGHNLIYKTQSGHVVKFTPNLDETVLAQHLLSWKNIHQMLPIINNVYQINSEYYGIWRENLDDINLNCCDLKNLWRSLIRSKCNKKIDIIKDPQCNSYLQLCHFNSLVDLYLWLLDKKVIIGDLGLQNWGFRKKQLVIRDFGSTELLPPLKEKILPCPINLEKWLLGLRLN